MPDERRGVDAGAVYERARLAFVATVASLHDEQLAVYVPAAPAWRVRDVLAHVIGLAADLNAQSFPAADDLGGSAWAGRQVAARFDVPLPDLLAEWDREAPGFEHGLQLFGYDEGCHFVADLHAHHQDVRGALGLARDDDDLTVRVALDHYLGFVGSLLADRGWGTLTVTAGGETWQVGGAGPHSAQVESAPFDVLRAFSARRSARQVRELHWSGDADALLDELRAGFTGGYELPVGDVVE